MEFSEYKYVGYKKKLNSIPLILEESTIPQDYDGERYKSVYRFNDDILEYKSLAGLKQGIKFYADYLVLDIDDKDLQGAVTSLGKVLEYLEFREVGYEAWFSGSKGFHILIPTSQFGFQPTDDADILKQMANGIAEKCKVKIDTSIYNVSRILRIKGSKHGKSGLYKIPLEDPTISLEAMQELAKAPIEDPFPEPDDYVMNDTLTAIYSHLTDVTKINRTILPTEDVKGSSIFTFPKEGGRNDACYKTSRKLARRSIGEAEALMIMEGWNRQLEQPLNETELKKAVLSAYTKGMNELVDESNYKSQFFNAERSLRSVKKAIINLKDTIVKTGYKEIDAYTMGFWKQDTIFIIARPGNFKTCIASNLLQRMGEQSGKKVIYFSMEMSPDRLNMRHMQNAESLNQVELIEKVKKGYAFEKYREKFKNVEVIGLSSLSIDMIIGLIDWFIEEKGEIGAIAFDYLSLFRGCANNTERTSQTITELKTRVAKAANCPTICLVQGRRKFEGDGGNIEISRDAGKDSSSIEDSADFMLGFWNHNGKQYGKFLKSRTFNSERFDENPYFEVDIDKPYMRLNDFKFLKRDEVPKFKQPQYNQE